MSRLTVTSKIIVIALIATIFMYILLTIQQCYHNNIINNKTPTVYYPQKKQPTLVSVQRPDGSSFIMDFALYRVLMQQGGVSSVNKYYNDNKNTPEFLSNQHRE